MVNFGPLPAEIVSLVWGTPGNFNWLAALLHGTLVVGVSQTAAFSRGRHLYSAGRPSRWALAHISSLQDTGDLNELASATKELMLVDSGPCVCVCVCVPDVYAAAASWVVATVTGRRLMYSVRRDDETSL